MLNTKKLCFTVGMIAVLLSISRGFAAEPSWKFFRGMCDASAVELLTDDLIVAGNDEDNVLRIFSLSRPGLPMQTVDFSAFYRLPKAKQEIDLEGSAKIGNRIFWISSHGANAKGKFQPSRHRFFATDIVTNSGTVTLRPAGQLYASLLRDLVREPSINPLNLAAAAHLPPKARGALNIEGLAATPEGHLLIGFRNPTPQGKALVVPLLNPNEVIEAKPARFGRPLRIDMGGLGVRSLLELGAEYIVVAGSFDGAGASKLFRWDGKSEKVTTAPPGVLPGNPEGIVLLKRGGQLSLLATSDDGTMNIGGKDCKKLKDANRRVFRAFELPILETP
jgi:hypothetical protein